LRKERKRERMREQGWRAVYLGESSLVSPLRGASESLRDIREESERICVHEWVCFLEREGVRCKESDGEKELSRGNMDENT
jgi:hypothetical protein